MFKRNKPIKLSVTTDLYPAFELFPVELAANYPPDWLAKMQTYATDDTLTSSFIAHRKRFPTIKACPGVSGTINKGVLLRNWNDVSIIVNPDGSYEYNGALPFRTPVEVHTREQYDKVWPNYIAIKLLSPWSFVEKTGVDFIMTPAVYHSNLWLTNPMPHGIMNFRAQHSSHVFLLAELKNETYEIFIKAGEPLAQLIPLSDRELEMDVSYSTSAAETSHKPFFLNGYKRAEAALKRLDTIRSR